MARCNFRMTGTCGQEMGYSRVDLSTRAEKGGADQNLYIRRSGAVLGRVDNTTYIHLQRCKGRDGVRGKVTLDVDDTWFHSSKDCGKYVRPGRVLMHRL